MDEPTSALDVVAQRSLMVQIKELQRELGFAVIFVTHDMSLVSHFSDRLMVMYAGQVAESGATRQVFDKPRHPYSIGLLEAFPSIRGRAGPADRHPRQPAGPGPAAGGLLVRAALPEGHGRLRRRPARACTRGTACWCGACADAGRDSVRRPASTGAGDRAAAAHRGPDQALQDRQRAVPAHPARGRRRQPGHRRAGDRRPGRGERQRQEHHRPAARQAVPADRAARSASRAGRCRELRSRRDTLRYTGPVPMVFQDPFSSINPVLPDLARHPARPEAAPARAVRRAAAGRGGAGVRGRSA